MQVCKANQNLMQTIPKSCTGSQSHTENGFIGCHNRPRHQKKTDFVPYEKQEMSQTRDECPQRNWSSIRHI